MGRHSSALKVSAGRSGNGAVAVAVGPGEGRMQGSTACSWRCCDAVRLGAGTRVGCLSRKYMGSPPRPENEDASEAPYSHFRACSPQERASQGGMDGDRQPQVRLVQSLNPFDSALSPLPCACPCACCTGPTGQTAECSRGNHICRFAWDCDSVGADTCGTCQ